MSHSFDDWLTDPGHVDDVVFPLGHRYLGDVGEEVIGILSLIPLFASVLAFHNLLTRYMHPMSGPGCRPRRSAGSIPSTARRTSHHWRRPRFRHR